MTEQQIRQIVQQELQRSNNASRFAVNSIPQHTHDGINSPQIKAESVIPAVSVVGNVEFAQATTYTLNLNASFTPRQILVNGVAAGSFGGVAVRSMFTGVAVLTPTFYFQPNDSDTSVKTGNIEYPFNGVPAQNSSSISIFRSSYDFGAGTVANPVFATASEFHIVSINMPTNAESDIQARATVKDFSRTQITIDVPVLASGWSLFVNYTIS